MTDLIAGYERHLRDLGRAASTIGTYIEELRRLDRVLPVGLVSANAEELKAWIYSDAHQPATRRLQRAIVAGFFRWCCDPAMHEHPFDFNPVVHLPKITLPQRKPRCLPEDRLYDILSRAVRPHLDWFLLASYAGLRCTEISALDVEHITEAEIWVHGKGCKERTVPTHPLIWALAEHLPSGPVAVDDEGNRLSREQVSHRGNYRLQRSLGHTGVSMHKLRRWFGTRAYEACRFDIRAVQELLGHAQVSTTQIYIAASPANMVHAVAGLPVKAA